MVLVQKWPFFQLYFIANIGEKNVFYDTIKRKNAFLGYKNKKFKNSKKWHFSNFFFRQYRPAKCLLRYSRTKKSLTRLKKKKFKKPKNWHVPKGVNPWFWSKNGHFTNFFFTQYRPGKCLLRYSRTKKRLSTL